MVNNCNDIFTLAKSILLDHDYIINCTLLKQEGCLKKTDERS